VAGVAPEVVPTPRCTGGVVPTLKKRADFLRLAKGARVSAAAFAVQAGPAIAGAGRFGFTVTKKCGSAPARNRIRRRLRAAARAAYEAQPPGFDVVIHARPAVLAEPFDRLATGLTHAISKAERRLVNSPAIPAPTPSPSA